MIDPTFASELNERPMAWRRVVSVGVVIPNAGFLVGVA
jgi:hypothetical protein